MQPRPTGPAPDWDTRRRDQAIADLIDACDVSWGSIELSVWNGRGIRIRSRHHQKPGAAPRAMPSDDAVIELDQTQRAARTLSELYNRPRAVFIVKVQSGKYSDIEFYDNNSDPPTRPSD